MNLVAKCIPVEGHCSPLSSPRGEFPGCQHTLYLIFQAKLILTVIGIDGYSYLNCYCGLHIVDVC